MIYHYLVAYVGLPEDQEQTFHMLGAAEIQLGEPITTWEQLEGISHWLRHRDHLREAVVTSYQLMRIET